MNNNVIVKIDGLQTVDDNKLDSQLLCEGYFEYDEDKAVISYTQISPEDNSSTTTEITVEGNEMVMTKDGGYNSRMQFCEGTRYLGSYETPYGTLNIGVTTNLLRYKLNESGGCIEIKYLLEMGSLASSFNELTITISPIKQGKD